jgi:hypothetical protein
MDILQLIELIALALLAGTFLGVMGAGGGGFYVIILAFFLNLPVETAIGTALALSMITAIAGVAGHWRSGNVDRGCSIYLSAAAIFGVVGGAVLIQYVSSDIIKYAIVAFFVAAGALSLVRIKQVQVEQDSKKQITRKWRLFFPGVVTGLVSGAFGLSGSTPLSSLLVSFFHLTPRRAVGTTLTSVLVTSLVGAIVYWQEQAIDFNVLLILGVGSVIGAYLGAKLTARVNRRALAIALAVAALGFGIYLALQS